MSTYEFTITIQGEGDSVEDAWNDAIYMFGEDPGEADGVLIQDYDEDDERPGHSLKYPFIVDAFDTTAGC